MNARIHKEHIESDRASELPFALKMELWNIFSSENSGSDKHLYKLSRRNHVIEINLRKFLRGASTIEKTFFWENPIKIAPPAELLIEVRDADILMRFPDEEWLY